MEENAAGTGGRGERRSADGFTKNKTFNIVATTAPVTHGNAHCAAPTTCKLISNEKLYISEKRNISIMFPMDKLWKKWYEMWQFVP